MYTQVQHQVIYIQVHTGTTLQHQVIYTQVHTGTTLQHQVIYTQVHTCTTLQHQVQHRCNTIALGSDTKWLKASAICNTKYINTHKYTPTQNTHIHTNSHGTKIQHSPHTKAHSLHILHSLTISTLHTNEARTAHMLKQILCKVSYVLLLIIIII